VIVVGVVVVAGGAAFFLVKGGDDGKTPEGIIDPSDLTSPGQFGEDVTPVKFSLRDTSTESTAAKSNADRAQVQTAAKDIRDTLGNMYTVAFIDPDNWKSGDYDTVYGFFEQGKPAESAKRDAATLTLGPNAGDMFDEVKPKYSGLRVKVLTDKGGEPFTAAATADFSADATKKDGSSMKIKSHATYYLQRGEGGWIIVAYKAARHDGGTAGAGSGSGSGDGGTSTTAPATTSTSGASQ